MIFTFGIFSDNGSRTNETRSEHAILFNDTLFQDDAVEKLDIGVNHHIGTYVAVTDHWIVFNGRYACYETIGIFA